MGKKIFIIVLILAAGAVLYLFYNSYSNKVRKIEELEKKYSSEVSRLKRIVFERDSLKNINTYLSRYRGLTDAMWYRDSLRLPLKYKIGDRVFLKRDSSKVVITDIILGGSQFEHYVKYRVLHKSNLPEEVIPELIY